MAPLTLREAYRHIIDTSAQSPVVLGIEPLLLEEPVLKLRVHLGASLFVDVFFNAETGKTSFALIKDGQRIYGLVALRGTVPVMQCLLRASYGKWRNTRKDGPDLRRVVARPASGKRGSWQAAWPSAGCLSCTDWNSSGP